MTSFSVYFRTRKVNKYWERKEESQQARKKERRERKREGEGGREAKRKKIQT